MADGITENSYLGGIGTLLSARNLDASDTVIRKDHPNPFGKICPKCGSSDVEPHTTRSMEIITYACNQCHAFFNKSGGLTSG